MSVVQVQNEKIYFDNGIPTDGGINDLRMGTMDKAMRCATCQGGKIIFNLSQFLRILLVISVC
jgi:DNA-directed RNA polymerase beta' subunit